jgi:predicted lipoprotein with Yx(FWY)xxD motif
MPSDLRNHSVLTRVALASAVAALSIVLTSCGGQQANGTNAGAVGKDATRAVVHTESHDGGPMLLVDRTGRTLYAANQEGSGKPIKCTGSCVGFWLPLTATRPAVRGEGIAADRLATVERPDGKMQVAFDGKPLYTFKLDTAAGMTKGDGITDSFNGTTFAWHAATLDGPSNQSPNADTNGTGGRYGY